MLNKEIYSITSQIGEKNDNHFIILTGGAAGVCKSVVVRTLYQALYRSQLRTTPQNM